MFVADCFFQSGCTNIGCVPHVLCTHSVTEIPLTERWSVFPTLCILEGPVGENTNKKVTCSGAGDIQEGGEPIVGAFVEK